jgi:hypothetical protein
MNTKEKRIRITSQNFGGPHKAEVVTFDETYPPMSGGPIQLSSEQLEVKFATLLAQAAYSGYDVEITKHNDPTKGMGGHIPHLIIRPDYQTARAAMTRAAEIDAHFKQHGCHGFTVADAEDERKVLFTMPAKTTIDG